jgi:hypothetical protein
MSLENVNAMTILSEGPVEADLVNTEAAVKQWFFNTFIFGAFGSFLAACFHRKSTAK